MQVCVNSLKFTLFRTFKNIVMDLMVQKYRFSKGRYIKQISLLDKFMFKKVRSYNTGKEGGGSRHSFGS